jgi:sigma-B regulation protein RsbU (phosphoserine phosphatase)
MNLWRKLGWLERVFLALLLIQSAAYLAGRQGALGFPLSILFLVVLYRHTRRALERLVWRVRNRLIVSYVFIAVVPIGLLLLLVGIGLWLLIGQVAVYTVYHEYRQRASTASGELRKPTPELLASLAPQLGEVILVDASSGLVFDGRFQSGSTELRARRIPPAANRLDIQVAGFTPVRVEGQAYLLAVFTRPSAVLRNLFGISVEGQEIYVYFFMAVGVLFLLAQIVSVVIGVSITRTLTGAVQNLYEATQRVQQGDLAHRIQVTGNDQLAELSSSFNSMTANLERLIEVEKERERLHSELEIARHVQARLFPKSAPHLRTLAISGMCQPARMVSGDYFDFLPLGDAQVALAIGDVAGKGISAALLMASMQSVLRSQLMEARSLHPRDLVGVLNRQLYANTTPEKYATFCLGVYDDQTRLFTYTNAGHLPPMLVSDGEAVRLEVTGTVVGAFPTMVYEERQVPLRREDLLVTYTDGITEPENAYGEMFGEQRLVEVLLKYRSEAPEEIIARTMEAVREWSACPEQEDDMTMVVARCVA